MVLFGVMKMNDEPILNLELSDEVITELKGYILVSVKFIALKKYKRQMFLSRKIYFTV